MSMDGAGKLGVSCPVWGLVSVSAWRTSRRFCSGSALMVPGQEVISVGLLCIMSGIRPRCCWCVEASELAAQNLKLVRAFQECVSWLLPRALGSPGTDLLE